MSNSNIIEEFDEFCRQQISRLRKSIEEEPPPIEIQTVPARLVPHAAGKRKPSLEQLDQMAIPIRSKL